MSARNVVTKSFAEQCLAFPDRVDAALAQATTAADAKGILDQAATMQKYAQQLRAGVEIERPIAIGVLKCKVRLGELLPRGNVGAGRGNKNGKAAVPFSRDTLKAYRKLADHQDRLEEYYEAIDDVPSQTDFIRYCGADGNRATKFTGAVDWFTPPKYIEKVRAVLGRIDLDPASSDFAQESVQAEQYYTADTDGLSREWRGTVFLNPPYRMPDVERFVFKLCDHVEADDVSTAILLTNNCTDTKWWRRAACVASAVCFTSGRISFHNRTGEATSPTNGQTFCYFGKARSQFEEHFSDVGLIMAAVE